MKRKTSWLQFRDSRTGHYCSAEYAAANPDTTQSITRVQEPEPQEQETPDAE
jgi:hypothetical protein